MSSVKEAHFLGKVLIHYIIVRISDVMRIFCDTLHQHISYNLLWVPKRGDNSAKSRFVIPYLIDMGNKACNFSFLQIRIVAVWKYGLSFVPTMCSKYDFQTLSNLYRFILKQIPIAIIFGGKQPKSIFLGHLSLL